MIVDGRIQWFGAEPFAYVCDEDLKRPTPIGALCAWCRESIAATDSGFIMRHIETSGVSLRAWHRECSLRSILGSVRHQRGTCSCFTGSGEHCTDRELDGLTEREEARLAVRIWEERNQ